jgi:hypothetical protein
VLGFFEMPEDDQPEPYLWLDDEGLVEHFAALRSKYRAKKEGDTELVPDADWDQNEFTKALR